MEILCHAIGCDVRPLNACFGLGDYEALALKVYVICDLALVRPRLTIKYDTHH